MTYDRFFLVTLFPFLFCILLACGPTKYSVEAKNEAGPVLVCFKGNSSAKLLKWGAYSLTDVTQYSGSNFETINFGETKKYESPEEAIVFVVISNLSALSNTNEMYWWSMFRADGGMLTPFRSFPKLIKYRITERGLEKPEIEK